MKTIYAMILFFFCLSAKAGWMWTGAVSSAWIEVNQNGKPGPILTNAFTMSAWIMRTLDRGATRAVIIAKGRTQPNPIPGDVCYEFSIVTNRLRFVYSGPGGGTLHTWEATGVAPNTNEVAHVVLKFTYGTPSSMALFVNGAASSGSWIVGNGTIPATNNNQSMMFGQDGFGTPFMGLFNEIAIWSSMLSNQEILTLYNARLKRYPLMVSPSTLVGYWPLDGWPENDDQTNDTVPLAINMKGDGTFYGSFEGFGGLCAQNERQLSYPPNE